MMSELIESLPLGVNLEEITVKVRGSLGGGELNWRISVMEVEHAKYSVGRAVAGQIAEHFRLSKRVRQL